MDDILEFTLGEGLQRLRNERAMPWLHALAIISALLDTLADEGAGDPTFIPAQVVVFGAGESRRRMVVVRESDWEALKERAGQYGDEKIPLSALEEAMRHDSNTD